MSSKLSSAIPAKGMIPLTIRDGPAITLKTSPKFVHLVAMEYFRECEVITVFGFCDWMGILYATYNDWLRNSSRCPFSKQLKKYHQMIGTSVIINASKSRINPVFGMFRLKNMFNWVDKREETVNHNIDINVQFKDMIKQAKVNAIHDVSRETLTLDSNGDRGPISKR